MNDIYLSLEPIYEHFAKLNNDNAYAKSNVREFIQDYKKCAGGCYCFSLKKIAINSNVIIKHRANPCETLDHETMHYILHKHFDMDVSRAWDNISHSVLEYIGMERYGF